MAKKWVILIGINNYSYLQPLRFAKADAEACKQALEESLGFDRLFLFTDDSPPISTEPPILTTPTFGHLDTFFDVQFNQQLLKPEDSLWFFFAGHGMRNNNGDYLILADSNPQRIDRTGLSLGYITERLRKWGAGNVVMFIDACRNENSGARSEDLSAANHQGIITFYSCGTKQKSYEIDKLGHGSFSYGLLEAFKQQEKNCFTVGKLEQYLIDLVPKLNSVHGKPIQYPLARVEPLERKESILFGKLQTQDIETLRINAFRKEYESPEDALNLWKTILKFNPDDPDAMSAIIRLAARVGSINNSPQVLMQEGITSRGGVSNPIDEANKKYQEKLDQYRQDFKQALEANYPLTGFARSMMNRLSQYLEIKKEDVEEIEKTVLANFEPPIEITKFYPEIDPKDSDAWFTKGFELTDYKQKIACYDKALEIKPDKHEAWYNRGVTLGNLGRNEEAITSDDKALEIKPDYHEAWDNRGVALMYLGRYEEAITSYDKALEIKPDYHQAWNNRGIALNDLGRYEEAITSYDKALEIKPDFTNAYYNKACLFALQTKIETALELLTTAIKLDPKYREMAKTDSDFDAIRDDFRFQALIQSKNLSSEN
jgi:uncharacterized caspase-like protein/tetratricopeptide (TPR) repeat protein